MGDLLPTGTVDGPRRIYSPVVSETSESRVPAWAVPLGLAVLVVTLGAVALIRGDGTADPTTPEGALQLYLQGINAHDWEQAYRFLDPNDFQTCQPTDIRDSGVVESFTAVHTETRGGDGSVVIVMDLRFGQGGFFGGWSSRTDFDMVQRDGFWYVTGDPWPHFRWNC